MRNILFGLLSLFIMTNAHASLTLAPLFSDHMVLQRDKTVKIWGTAEANEKVTVSIANQSVTTHADNVGNWQVKVPANSKGGPYTLNVSATDKLTIQDVYFGDVWIAGGQSNMEWKLSWGVNNAEQEAKDADYPRIRVFEVPNVFSFKKEPLLPASSWKVANAENVMEFSAIAWFFAKHLQDEQDVAVGIIDSNWGGTPAEAWADVDKVASVNGYEERAQEVINTQNWQQIIDENTAQEAAKYQLLGDFDAALATNAYKNDYDLSQWQEVTLPNKQPLRDLTWLRKSFELSSAPTADAELYLGDIVQHAFIFINGELIAKEDWQNSESRHAVSASILKQGTNQITMRIANDWDNNAYAGRPGEMWLATESEKVTLEGSWLSNNKLQPPMPKVKRFSFTPGFLYNAMMHPLLPYTSKGVIWYQGESNVGEYSLYQELFSTMITNWRERAGDLDLPFLFVQLAAYLKPQELQPQSAWAYLRDSQRQTLSLPHTAMATTIDIGDAENIHPANKQDVGLRLWLQAKRMVYGDSNIPSGPDYKSYRVEGDKIVLNFNFADGLHTKDNASPKGFIIAGEDKQFFNAEAKINGTQITVSHPDVAEPVAVRYAWADFPHVNLVNGKGLPAIPFRTDSWQASEVK